MSVKYNPAGVYLTTDGEVYQDSACTIKIEPKIDSRGYKYIPALYLNRRSKNTELEYGYYLHRMMVLTFKDRNGHDYFDGCVIDHINMNHGDDCVDNLEIVNSYINLARAVRAYPDDPGCRDRYENAMKKLHEDAAEAYDIIKASILGDSNKYPICFPGLTDGCFTIRRDDEEK